MKSLLLDVVLPPFGLLVLLSVFMIVWAPRRRRLLLAGLVGLVIVLHVPAIGLLLWAPVLLSVPALPSDPGRDAYAVVVPTAGADVYPDGVVRAGDLTLRRAIRGQALANELGVPLVIVGGRPGNLPLSEAEAVARQLLPAEDGSAPLLGTDSRDTCENAREARTILEPLGIQMVVAATDRFHLPRFAACLRHYGLRPYRPIHAIPENFMEADRWRPGNVGGNVLSEIAQAMIGLIWYGATGRVNASDFLSSSAGTP